jgi:phosphoglucomutase
LDPFQQQPPPVGELASTLAPTNQVVNAITGINIATSDPAASTRITPAPAGDDTLADGAIVVNSSDSPLSDSSEERV